MRLRELTDAQMHYGTAENLLGKLALCVFEGGITKEGPATVAARRFPLSESVETIVKAAQSPAMSTNPGYAAELVRTAHGELLDTLRGTAILPSCVPLSRQHTFEGGSIYVPRRIGGSAAGSFRAEGAPIAVRGLLFDHILLSPKNVGVILTSTGELMRRSSIDLAQYFQNEIVADTGEVLDQIFVGNGAASAIQPAGARNGLTVADTRASTGATAAQISADVKTMVTALTTAKFGNPATTRWLMNPKNLTALSLLLTTGGSLQFPEAQGAGLAGYPVVTSSEMDPSIILLIDFSAYTFAMGTPQFEPTEIAQLHEEDTTPLPIANSGTLVVAQPARSLFQTFVWALRMVLDADWAKLRAVGPVQELTAVAW